MPVSTPADLTSFQLDGRSPEDVYEPSSEEDSVAVVRRASAKGQSLVPCGGGTAIRQGNPVRAQRWAVVSTRQLASPIEFSPDDMVVTASAGTSLSQLQ